MDDSEIFEKAIKQALDLKYYYIQGLAKDVYAMIFSHKFAKAFWGEEWKDIEQVVNESANFTNLKRWQYHLQQMVLKENPLKYLEKFLKDEKN